MEGNPRVKKLMLPKNLRPHQSILKDHLWIAIKHRGVHKKQRDMTYIHLGMLPLVGYEG